MLTDRQIDVNGKGQAGFGEEILMSAEVIATILSAVGVLIGVWKMVDRTRRELGAKIDSEIETVNQRIESVIHWIDAVLPADRR